LPEVKTLVQKMPRRIWNSSIQKNNLFLPSVENRLFLL